MFKRVLLFSQGAAESLYDNQMITTLDVLQDLTDDIIKEICCAIRKPEGDGLFADYFCQKAILFACC